MSSSRARPGLVSVMGRSARRGHGRARPAEARADRGGVARRSGSREGDLTAAVGQGDEGSRPLAEARQPLQPQVPSHGRNASTAYTVSGARSSGGSRSLRRAAACVRWYGGRALADVIPSASRGPSSRRVAGRGSTHDPAPCPTRRCPSLPRSRPIAETIFGHLPPHTNRRKEHADDSSTTATTGRGDRGLYEEGAAARSAR
jgi:hypothetical protein